MAHKDGPSYKNKVLIISLGSPTVMKFTHDTSKENFEILLEENSGIIFCD